MAKASRQARATWRANAAAAATAAHESRTDSSTGPTTPVLSVEPLLPNAQYSSYFELLEATPASNPFHTALASFIRAPDAQKPAALRRIWEQATELARAPTPTLEVLEEVTFIGLERGLERGREEGYKEGYKVGREEGYAIGHEGQRMELVDQLELLELTEKAALAKGRKEISDVCQRGECHGARRERVRWSKHTATGRCLSGHPQLLDATTQTSPKLREVATQADIPVASSLEPATLPPATTTTLDWAEDASTIPIIPIFSQRPPRDLSILRTETARPFGSLQHRLHRSFPRQCSRTRSKRPSYSSPTAPRTHAPPPTPNYATKPRYSLPAQHVWTKNSDVLTMLVKVLQLFAGSLG